MNPDAAKRIWKFSKHKLTDKLLLLALTEYADGDSVCFPGYETLGEAVGVNRRSAIRIVEKLAESGELFYKPTVGRGNTNLYFVVVGLSTGEAKRVLMNRFDMLEEQAEHVTDSLLKKGVIYDIKSVTDDTILDVKGVMGDVKGVMGNTRISSTSSTTEHAQKEMLTQIGNLCREHFSDPGQDPFRADLLQTIKKYSAAKVLWAIQTAKSPKRANGKPKSWGYVVGILEKDVLGGKNRAAVIPGPSPPQPSNRGKSSPIDADLLEQLQAGKQ